VTTVQPGLTNAEFDALFQEVSNWDTWGAPSARGTLNYLTPDRVDAAARLVRAGTSLSLSLPLDSDASLHNPVPAQHRMTQLADDKSTSEQFITDYVGADYHNDGHTHLDALCHVSYLGKLFTGVPASSVTEAGAALGDVTTVRDGIVGRGVLLDIPRLLVVHVGRDPGVDVRRAVPQMLAEAGSSCRGSPAPCHPAVDQGADQSWTTVVPVALRHPPERYVPTRPIVAPARSSSRDAPCRRPARTG
jgi:hypothetical protein